MLGLEGSQFLRRGTLNVVGGRDVLLLSVANVNTRPFYLTRVSEKNLLLVVQTRLQDLTVVVETLDILLLRVIFW